MAKLSIGPLDGIDRDQCRAVGDGRVAVVRIGDEVVAFQNECLHQASPLAGGLVKDDVLICPLHFWRYDLPAAEHVGTGTGLETFATEIVDGEVWVDMPPEAEPKSMREQLLDHAREWSRDE